MPEINTFARRLLGGMIRFIIIFTTKKRRHWWNVECGKFKSKRASTDNEQNPIATNTNVDQVQFKQKLKYILNTKKRKNLSNTSKNDASKDEHKQPNQHELGHMQNNIKESLTSESNEYIAI